MWSCQGRSRLRRVVLVMSYIFITQRCPKDKGARFCSFWLLTIIDWDVKLLLGFLVLFALDTNGKHLSVLQINTGPYNFLGARCTTRWNAQWNFRNDFLSPGRKAPGLGAQKYSPFVEEEVWKGREFADYAGRLLATGTNSPRCGSKKKPKGSTPVPITLASHWRLSTADF